MCDIVPSILSIGKCGWCGQIVLGICLAVLVISLKWLNIFLKKVVNDVIKSEVSTGVGIFFGRAAAKPGQKSDIGSFLTSYTTKLQTLVLYLLLIDICD